MDPQELEGQSRVSVKKPSQYRRSRAGSGTLIPAAPHPFSPTQGNFPRSVLLLRPSSLHTN